MAEIPSRLLASLRLLPALVLLAVPACSESRGSAARGVVDAGTGSGPPHRPLEGRAFCGRDRSDGVRDVFCKEEEAPGIGSLRDLEDVLGLTVPAPDSGSCYFGVERCTSSLAAPVVLVGHSTALSGHLVSQLNPRAILVGDRAFLAFNRGVQQVELASVDRSGATVNFYLVTFEQACSHSESGCTPGDLYTPRIESNWESVRIQDDEDLKNTPSDCRQCHQRGREDGILLMRELDGPWTHFFGPEVADAYQTDGGIPEPSGLDLLKDYLRAKGDEPYAGLPTAALRETAGITLQFAMRNAQPLVFDGSAIMNELWPWSRATGYRPAPVRSETWDRDYQAFKRGELLPLPYFATRTTDADKLATLTDAYQRYRRGEVAAQDLPDLANVFSDDPQTRAELGLQTEPNATPAEALVQACGTCHNDVLDQTISRALFNIDLARMTRGERDLAVERITRDRGAPGAMPPEGRRQLDDEGRTRLVEYLRSGTRTTEDDAFLAHAAAAGMAGKQPRLPSGF